MGKNKLRKNVTTTRGCHPTTLPPFSAHLDTNELKKLLRLFHFPQLPLDFRTPCIVIVSIVETRGNLFLNILNLFFFLFLARDCVCVCVYVYVCAGAKRQL